VMHVLKDDKRDGLNEDKRDVHYARFSPNGSRVLTVSHDGVRIWDAKTGGLLKILNEPLLESAVFSADATRVLGVPLSSQLKPKVTVWDAQSGEILSVFLGSPKFAAFNPTGEQVLLLGSQIGTWSVQPRNAGLILPHEQDVFAAAFSPDDTRVITAMYGGRGRIFDAATGEALRDLRPAGLFVTDAGFSPDGRTAVTISEHTRLWDAITGNLIAEFDDKSVEFARGTGHLLSLAKNGMVRLRDGHSGTLIMEFAAGENVERVMFASDGRRVLMALKTSIQVLDPDTGATNTIIPADERIVMIGSFSPDRRRVLTLSPQRHAHVWDLDSGQMLHELAGYYEGWIHGSEFSRDGRLLLVSNDSGTWVWDVDENRIIASLHTQVTSHRKMVGSTIQFTPDSRRILELKFPNRVDVWDVATGKSVASLKHKDTILSASWDRAGHRIVTASRDHTARIWPVPETQALVNSAKNDAPRCLTQKERERAFLDPAPPAWCIEAAKWPYRSPDWKEWLAFQRHDPTVPLPETKEWATWRAARGAAVQ
jgi:WD40 repeat protein